MTPKIKNGNHVIEETNKRTLILRPGKLTLADLRVVYENPIKLILHESAYDQIRKSSDCVDRILKDNRITYGINTGIGKLASTKISKEDLQTLQRAIVTSHTVGIGPDADDATVRLIMVLKINSLSRGFSGIRQKVIDALVALVNAEVYPQIPVKGSVGASGDLAPLAHMSVVLIGEGKARCQGKWLTAKEAMAKAGLEPMALAPKEGVALINGAQVSAAFALRGLFAADDLFVAALVCGSLSVEAGLGSRKAFDERIHAIRGQPGQIDAAAAYRELLDSRSEISDSHQNCVKVQDPYSFRCQPQVMGACLTQIRNAAEVLRIEANAVTDNPLIFHEHDEAISGGNFHAEPSAMAADNLALALAEIASISERRIALLMDHNMSQLPGFLVKKSGLFSGFMTAHVTAAALVSENKCLSHPACVDSIPTSGNQEDHVSMAPAAGRRLWDMAENVWGVLAIEWLSACQGLDFRVGLRSSAKLESARAVLREKVSFYEDDRIFAPDIDEALKLLKGGCLKRIVDTSFLPSM